MAKESVSTSDIYLAAFLRSKGIRYTGHRMQGKRMLFLFQRDSKAEELITAYQAGVAVCDPKSMRDSVRDLKSMVNSDSRNSNTI